MIDDEKPVPTCKLCKTAVLPGHETSGTGRYLSHTECIDALAVTPLRSPPLKVPLRERVRA